MVINLGGLDEYGSKHKSIQINLRENGGQTYKKKITDGKYMRSKDMRNIQSNDLMLIFIDIHKCVR